eukprot:scaffold285565_cov32-Tisochrysis_lutea.AAC.1
MGPIQEANAPREQSNGGREVGNRTPNSGAGDGADGLAVRVAGKPGPVGRRDGDAAHARPYAHCIRRPHPLRPLNRLHLDRCFRRHAAFGAEGGAEPDGGADGAGAGAGGAARPRRGPGSKVVRGRKDEANVGGMHDVDGGRHSTGARDERHVRVHCAIARRSNRQPRKRRRRLMRPGAAHLARYKHECSSLLTQALTNLEQIDRVRYVDCSFPSVPSEAPRLSLDKWNSLSASEWQLRWSPSWSIQVRWLADAWPKRIVSHVRNAQCAARLPVQIAVEGSHYVAFRMILRIHSVQLAGTLRVNSTKDLRTIRLSFVEQPQMRMCVDCTIAWGSLPLPLQDYIGDTVVGEFRAWFNKQMVRLIAPQNGCEGQRGGVATFQRRLDPRRHRP